MKKIFTLLSTAFLFAASLSAQNIAYNWAISGGGSTGADRALTITKDADGNVYSAGVFLNEATFAGFSFTGSAKGSGANYDNSLFLTKMEAGSENFVWKIYSDKGAVNPTSITTTANGDVVLVGNVRAVKDGATASANIIDTEGTETTFDNLPNAATGIRGFIAKFDTNGKKLWIREVATTSSATKKNDVSDVTVDDEGNIYIVGYYDADVTLPSGSQIMAVSTQSAYIAKLDGNTGNEIWVKTATTTGIKKESFDCITFDGNNIYAAGVLTNQTAAVNITIGGVELTPSAYPDPVIVKLDKEGNFVYVQHRKHVSASITGNTMVRDLTVKDSKVYLVGNFKGELSFSNGNIISTTNLNGFTFAFDAATGSDIWQNMVSSPALNETSAIEVGSDKICTYGYFYNKTGANTGDADFGNGIILNTGETNTLGDLYFAIYDMDGTILSADVIAKGTAAETSLAGMTSIGNDIYLFGSFQSPTLILYGTEETLSTQGAFDFFIAKYTLSNFVVSVENNSKSAYKVYIQNQVLHIEGESITDVDVYSISGTKVAKSTYSQGQNSVELSLAGLPKGIYLIKTKSNSGSIETTKIIF